MGDVCVRLWPSSPAAWDARRLVNSVWSGRTGSLVLTFYRFIIAAYLISVALYDWSRNNPRPATYLCFLTNIGVWCCILYFWSAVALGVLVHADTWAQARGRECLTAANSVSFRTLTRCTQMLFQFSVTLEVIIVSLYWLMLYKSAPPTAIATWINSTVHAVAGAAVWLDLLIGANRPIDAHVSAVVILGLAYLLLNLSITLTVQVLYPILTWRDSGSFVLAAGTLLGVVLIYFGVSSIAFVRDALVTRCMPVTVSAAAVATWPAGGAAYEVAGIGHEDVRASTGLPQPTLQMARAFRSPTEPPRAFFLDGKLAFPLSTLPCVRRSALCRSDEADKAQRLLQAEAVEGADAENEALFAVRPGATTGRGHGYVLAAERLDAAIHPL